ncbi:Diaminopimelate epimerase-like protein, partial [Polyplosphaeria fusca]
MKLPYTTLDVFTRTPFLGNPLAIIRLPHPSSIPESQKQAIATEFNLSESVFLSPPDESGTALYEIFTARSRITFAGHPTIGTAHHISAHPALFPHTKRLRTAAGDVEFAFDARESVARVRVPHHVRVHNARLPHPFARGEGNPTDSASVPIVSIVKGMAFSLVACADLGALGRAPGSLVAYDKIYACEHLDAGSGWDVGLHGTFYFCDLGQDPEDKGRRLVRTRSISSREDPGTGSASSALCCWLGMKGVGGEGREKRFHLVQGVEMGRRCDIFVDVVMEEGGEGVEEVRMSGGAVEVMEGVIEV